MTIIEPNIYDPHKKQNNTDSIMGYFLALILKITWPVHNHSGKHLNFSLPISSRLVCAAEKTKQPQDVFSRTFYFSCF